MRAGGGDVDILVNNTGGPPPTPIVGIAPEDWRKQLRLMVVAVMRLTDLVLPAMRERGWGRIITSASSGVVAPIPNLGISNALRLVLVGWSKTLAGEVGGDGVTANIVVPGRIATARVRSLDEAKAGREGVSVDEVARAAPARSRSAATASPTSTRPPSHSSPARARRTSPARWCASTAG